MKKINVLIPTDFSETAATAFKYAQAMLAKTASFKVLHADYPHVDASYPASFEFTAKYLYDKQKAELEAWTKKNTLNANIETDNIETEIKIGFPSDVIVDQSKENTDVVIMGGTGATNMLDKIFGSVASHVAMYAHCPVLIIPKDTAFKGFKNILFACDYASVEERFLKEVTDFAKTFKAKIHFIHVQAANDNSLNTEIENRLFRYLFADEAPRVEFNMATIEADSVTKGLNQYIDENNIDLTVLVAHKRNFWENIVHKSITKEMAINTHIPSLVYHDAE